TDDRTNDYGIRASVRIGVRGDPAGKCDAFAAHRPRRVSGAGSARPWFCSQVCRDAVQTDPQSARAGIRHTDCHSADDRTLGDRDACRFDREYGQYRSYRRQGTFQTRESGMSKYLPLLILSFGMLLVSACGDSRIHSHGVYMLVDTSGTYDQEMNKASKIINYLLATLNPGDSLAVAKVETRSFTEKDIIAKVTFDTRPSKATSQKRAFKTNIAAFAKGVKGSAYTDITGGLIQGAEYLNETKAGIKTIVVFSDMQEELGKGTIRDFPIKLNGIRIVALNVTKLGTDNADPRRYLDRLARWEASVRKAGATEWVVVNDLENNMESILTTR